MPDTRDRLAIAFDELHAAVARRTRLPGLPAARAMAQRRHATRVAVGTAAAVAVLLVAVVVGIGTLRTGAPPPPAATTPPVTTSPSSTVAPAPVGPPLADQVPPGT